MRAPRFDSEALFRALDETRRERGLTWRELAAETGVADSTLRRTRLGRPLEADGMLAMVRVVGRAPEDFAQGPSATGRSLKQGRFDTQALSAALDAERRERGLSWAEASREIGASSANAVRRLADGGRIDADLVLACTWWLGRPVDDFVVPVFEHPGEVRRRSES